MNRYIRHLLRTSFVAIACLFLSVGATAAQEKAQVPASQSSEARKSVPTRKLELVVPANPPQRAQLYCCNATSCFPVDAFKACFPDELKMVCDVDGICFPIKAVAVKGSKILLSK